jgi:hypothetical protein
VLDRLQGPLFRRGEGRVDEGFTQIDPSAVAEVFGQSLEQAVQPPRPLPQLEAPMAGLIRRVATREIRPRGTGPQNPQDRVQDGARIGPRTPAAIGTAARAKGGFEHGPLGVGEVHAVEYDGHRNFVHRPTMGFMR